MLLTLGQVEARHLVDPEDTPSLRDLLIDPALSGTRRAPAPPDLDGLQDVIWQASDPMIVMHRVVEQTLLLVPAAAGAAVELMHKDRLTNVCSTGCLSPLVGTTLRLEGSLSGAAVTTGETLYASDCASDDRVDHDTCRQVGASSLICVPLRRELRPIGVLKICARKPHAFQRADIGVLSRLGDFISAIIGASQDIADAAGQLVMSKGAAYAAEASGESPARAWSRELGADPVGKFVANVLCPDVVTGLALRDRIAHLSVTRNFTMVGQPIVNIDTGDLLGVEALARFPAGLAADPDGCFREARRLGLGLQLELAAAEVAVSQLSKLPEHAYLAINLGPDTIASGELVSLLEAHQPERIVIELTEHTQVDDYDDFRPRIEAIRALGTRLAIDDTGAGFSSLAHILNLAPDMIKLDRLFVRGIDKDPARRAVAQSLMSLARDTGAGVIAEGVETESELETIRRFGFAHAQGYLVARPAAIERLPRSFPHLRADRDAA